MMTNSSISQLGCGVGRLRAVWVYWEKFVPLPREGRDPCMITINYY